MLPAVAAPASEPAGALGTVPQVESSAPVVPDYGGACLSSVVPAIVGRDSGVPRWMPAEVAGVSQVVLLVVDGLGWEQLQGHRASAPFLAGAVGGPITSVVPTTTATALTSITTGCTPAEHGVLGYRLAVPADSSANGGSVQVLNVLHWTDGTGDVRRRLPATTFQPRLPFAGGAVSVVTRSEFSPTGFTAAHLHGTRVVGWRVPSTLVVEVRRLLQQGDRLVYAYYDGVDKVAHEHGLGEHYQAELRAVDRLVGDLVEVLPAGAALVVTSDHGQVEVTEPARLPAPELLAATELISGEGRFRWFHGRPGAAHELCTIAEDTFGDEAWVRSRQQVIDEGWFGGPLRPEVEKRLGDVAVVARAPVAFLDPADTGETRLLARHGSLTSAEMLVPLLAWTAG